MPRFPNFLKSSKKNANKENVPSKGHIADLANAPSGVYTGEKQLPPHIPNPYDVVSAPKTTRATRSWACGPSTDLRSRDTHSMFDMPLGVKPFSDRQPNGNNSVRHYENLQRNSQHRSTGPISSKSAATCNNRHLNSHHGSLKGKQEYYEDCAESDEDDLCDENDMLKQRVHDLERKLSRVVNEYRELKLTARHYEKDLDYYSREFDKEMGRSRKLGRKLKDANARVKELEEQLALRDRMHVMEFYNLNSQNSGGSASGAGEALCGNESSDIRELTNADTPSIMFGGRIDLDDQDEVRNFRTIEDVSDDDQFSIDSSYNQRMSVQQQKPPVYSTNVRTPGLNRSLSDTDVFSLSVTPDEPQEGHQHNSSTWDRGTVRPRKYNQRYRAESEATADTSSEDGRVEECYRQLRKKGDVVQYKPPRRKIQPKYYKPKFGKSERAALAEMEFIYDMSSDFSHIQSSPDSNRHTQYQLSNSRRQ